MAYTIAKLDKIKANKRTPACQCCEKKRTASVYHRETVTVIDEGVIWKGRFYTCAKCAYKIKSSLTRAEVRRQKAFDGLCEMADFQMYSWKNGSLYGGNCQEQCRACNIGCAFGDIGTF